MKSFFYFGLIFIFLMFNCSNVVFATTSDFSGTFKGTESGSTSSTDKGTFSGTGTGTFDGSGSGSIDNSGSVASYVVYCNLATSVSSLTGDTTSSNYSFKLIGSQYYLNSVPNTPYISGVPSKTAIYFCYYKPTGSIFYTGGNSPGNYVYTPVNLTIGNGSSDFIFSESGSTTSKDSGSYSGTSSGSYSGSVTGTLAGAVDNLSGFGGFPPAFPVSTGISYSQSVNTGSILEDSLTISSNGVTIPDGYDFGFCTVTYSVTFTSDIPITPGSYVLSFLPGGTPSISGSFPSQLRPGPNCYVTNAFTSAGTMNVTGFVPFNGSYSTRVYFDISTSDTIIRSLTGATFTAIYFVTENIPSFNYKITQSYQNPLSFLFRSDDSSILSELKNQNNSLTSAGGANSGLNSQNQLMDGALSDYQRDTDTSSQYSNISDDLFVLDTSIFTQVASTITLFSSVVSGLFTAFGDFSVPLTLMLIVTLISCIIGIIKISSDSS